MSVHVDGQAEIEAAMREARAELRTVFAEAKKQGAEVLRSAVVSAWPKRSGRMAGQWTAYTNQSTAGVRNSHPGANVVEFATDYQRKTPSGGTTTVHVGSGPAPPRYAFPVRDRMSDEIIDIADVALHKALQAKGWFE